MTKRTKDLYQAVADHLCGQRVELHFKKPFISGSNGIAYKQNGRSIIQVDPDLRGEQKLKTFLHECGHINTPIRNNRGLRSDPTGLRIEDYPGFGK
jgi:hypothetical protein